MQKFASIAAGLALLTVAAPAFASVTVTPVAVTATDTFPFFGQYKAENLIDGSGLSGNLHNADYAAMWMTDLSVDAATLTFDLGEVFNLNGLQVWNYNFGVEEFFSTLDRGAKAFTLSFSIDGVAYAQALAGEFARSGGGPLAAESFAVKGQARYVQLSLTGNHQRFPETYGYAPIGLSEVRFTAAVPEPGAWGLMILGFGGAGAMLRRRRAAFA